MGRSAKKGPFIDERLLKKLEVLEQKKEKHAIKTWFRNTTISPEFIGYTFNVHNGKTFLPVFVTESMVGHKLGEFVPTRTFRGHAGSKNK